MKSEIIRTYLTYDEKIKIFNLVDELPPDIPRGKLAVFASQVIERNISRQAITRLLEKRSEALSNPGDNLPGCRIKSSI